MMIQTEKKLGKQRDSNLELFRIILMLLIIAHHYVVNSGLTDMNGPIAGNLLSAKSVALLIVGAWGKICINCFVLITGYFYCKQSITAAKFFKLLFQVIFYSFLIGTLFLVIGYIQPSADVFLKMIFPFTEVGKNFTGTFLLFFLCIPFLNILIQSMTEKQHFTLILVLGFIYVFLGTIPYIKMNMNYVSWFSVIYLIAAYIRCYPKNIYTNFRLWIKLLIAALFLCVASIITCTLLGTIVGPGFWYIFVTDCNTFLALATSICAFFVFKNLNIGYSKFINSVSATTFGVFLIHANIGMADWLWKDTLRNVEMYYSPWLPLHVLLSVFGVFIVCSLIDYIRMKTIEKPFFRFWNRLWLKTQPGMQKRFDSLCRKLDIGD